MGDLYSDYERLWGMYAVPPFEIDVSDLFKATSLSLPIGAKVPRELWQQRGIDPTDAIERLSAVLLRHADQLRALSAAPNVSAPVRTNKSISESTINFLAWEMLIRCSKQEVQPPSSLMNLLRMQLRVRSETAAREEAERGYRFAEACRFVFNNPGSSMRAVASAVGVNVSTISRWSKDSDLEEIGRHIQQAMDQVDVSVREQQRQTRQNSMNKDEH